MAVIINEDEHSKVGVGIVTDNGDYTYIAYTYNDRAANATHLIVDKLHGTTVVEQREVHPLGGAKGDICALTIAGSDLLVAFTAHRGGGTPQYASSVQLERLVGFCVPYPQGHVQQGGAVTGDFSSSGESGSGTGTGTGTGGTPVTDADIQKIADAVANAVAQRFGNGGDIRAAIASKVAQALDEKRVLTEGMVSAGGSPSVYQQQINTAYTGALGALRDHK